MTNPPFAQKRTVLSFLFHKKKGKKEKAMERGTPELKVLYMCSSSGVKKALNQPSVKIEKKKKMISVSCRGCKKAGEKVKSRGPASRTCCPVSRSPLPCKAIYLCTQ